MNFENIETIQQPKDLRKNLFQHQLSLVYKMEKLEKEKLVETQYYKKETNIGINAEMTGYGKTLSMIALLLRNKMEWNLEEPYIFENIYSESGGRIKVKKTTVYKKLPTNLILVSQSIIKQWEKEFEESNLKIDTVTTSKKASIINVEEYDAILVIPTMFNKLLSRYNNYAWKRFIFDEPGHIKVAAMKMITAGFYWFVTATPNSIYSQHRSCRNSIMSEIFKGSYWDIEHQFYGMIIKNPIEYVKHSFTMPETFHKYYECFQQLYNTVKDFAAPNILEMIAGDNIAGAIETLGGNKTDNIVELIKRKKYEELEEINAKINIYSIRGDVERKKEWENRKNSISKKIQDIENKFKDVLTSNCSICFDIIKSPILEPKCQNIFCGSCFLTWLHTKPSCPLCRQIVDANDLVYICKKEEIESTKSFKKKDKKIHKLTKQETIVDIISNKKDGKFIIFSAWDQSWGLITDLLVENDISFTEIKGRFETRDRNIKLFKDGNIQVVFLNTQNNASGVNLQEATDIILYHEMGELTMQQVMGRALRLGREISLTVHHLQ